jgi:hypothetical protein
MVSQGSLFCSKGRHFFIDLSQLRHLRHFRHLCHLRHLRHLGHLQALCDVVERSRISFFSENYIPGQFRHVFCDF